MEMDLLKTCKICLEQKSEVVSLCSNVMGRNIPLIIEKISGIQINAYEIPDGQICQDCALALIQAESIIEKCRSSLTLLLQCPVKEEIAENTEIETACYEPAAVLEESLIEIEAKEQLSGLLTSAIDNLDKNKISDDEKPEVLSIRRKRKYTRKKEGKREAICQSKVCSEPTAALEEALIEIEDKEQITECFTTAVEHLGELKNSEEDEDEYKESELLSIRAVHKRKYTRKKEGKRVLTSNSKADWHFKCDLCAYESIFAAYYKNHLKEVHKIEKPKIFKCIHCNESYQLHSSMRRHVAVVHENQPRPPRAKNILCSECGKKFPCRNSLRIHMHTHTGEALPFVCTESDCSKSFASMAVLKNHITSAHTKEKKFACDICGNTFAVIFSLRTHMSICHLGNEMKDCPNCGRSYRSQKKYDEHVLAEKCKNNIHPCQFPNCNKRFSRPRKMRQHMMNKHRPKGETNALQNLKIV